MQNEPRKMMKNINYLLTFKNTFFQPHPGIQNINCSNLTTNCLAEPLQLAFLPKLFNKRVLFKLSSTFFLKNSTRLRCSLVLVVLREYVKNFLRVSTGLFYIFLICPSPRVFSSTVEIRDCIHNSKNWRICLFNQLLQTE